jgi:hypothetical protein
MAGSLLITRTTGNFMIHKITRTFQASKELVSAFEDVFSLDDKILANDPNTPPIIEINDIRLKITNTSFMAIRDVLILALSPVVIDEVTHISVVTSGSGGFVQHRTDARTAVALTPAKVVAPGYVLQPDDIIDLNSGSIVNIAWRPSGGILPGTNTPLDVKNVVLTYSGSKVRAVMGIPGSTP